MDKEERKAAMQRVYEKHPHLNPNAKKKSANSRARRKNKMQLRMLKQQKNQALLDSILKNPKTQIEKDAREILGKWLEEKKYVSRKDKKIENTDKTPTYKPGMKIGFYQTREWRDLRWEYLKRAEKACTVCGATRKVAGYLHVDHILPRSKYPELELHPENLQLLCKDCNYGKSNKVEPVDLQRLAHLLK